MIAMPDPGSDQGLLGVTLEIPTSDLVAESPEDAASREPAPAMERHCGKPEKQPWKKSNLS